MAWLGRHKILTAILGSFVLLIIIGALAGENEQTRDTTAETTPRPSPVATESGDVSNECGPVGQALLDALNVEVAAAVEQEVERQPGLRRLGRVWFVTAADGATWVTNGDPTQDIGRLVLPLNPEARARSDLGVDAPPDSAIYAGVTNDDPGAVRARECARS